MITYNELVTEIKGLQAKALSAGEIIIRLSQKYKIRRSDIKETLFVMNYLQPEWVKRKNENNQPTH